MWVITKFLRLIRNVHMRGCCTWNVHSFLRAGFFGNLNKLILSLGPFEQPAATHLFTIFTKLQSEKQLQDLTLTSPHVHTLSRPQQEDRLGCRQGEINTFISPERTKKFLIFFHYIQINRETNMWTFVCTFINDMQVCMISCSFND